MGTFKLVDFCHKHEKTRKLSKFMKLDEPDHIRGIQYEFGNFNRFNIYEEHILEITYSKGLFPICLHTWHREKGYRYLEGAADNTMIYTDYELDFNESPEYNYNLFIYDYDTEVEPSSETTILMIFRKRG